MKVKLIHGDCLERMKEIEDGSIDLTVTSPPYDNLRTYKNTLDWGEHIWKPVLHELFRITKKGGVVVWVVGDATIKGSETGTSFRQALYAMECGFNLHDTMIYAKDAISFPDKNRYQAAFEYMFVFSKGGPNTKNIIYDRINLSFGRRVSGTYRQKNGETKKAFGYGNNIKEFGARWNIWHINTDKGNNKTGHPAQFPAQIANDHIISWSKEGDTVFDPFMGSGTTGKMAVLNKRNFIGIEKVKEYLEISKDRIGKAYNEMTKEVLA